MRGRADGSQPTTIDIPREPSAPAAFHQGAHKASEPYAGSASLLFFYFSNKNSSALCPFSKKQYLLPACLKPHTAPRPESHTQLCRGRHRGGGEGSCSTKELKQDIPSALMTRPVTPMMRKTDVFQKVSRCLILGVMKMESSDIIFSLGFHPLLASVWLQEILQSQF